MECNGNRVCGPLGARHTHVCYTCVFFAESCLVIAMLEKCIGTYISNSVLRHKKAGFRYTS